MSDTKKGLHDTRAIVLIDDEKEGKAGELVRASSARAGNLVEARKARWATKADFGLA